MNTLLFQREIFHENDDEHIKSISKYFDVEEVNPEGYNSFYTFSNQAHRYSIAMAKKYRGLERFTNALEWAGKLRNEMVSHLFHFQTLDHIIDEWKGELNHDYYDDEIIDSRRFIRPVSGDKVFAGNVFSIKTFQNEIDFLMQRNVDPHTVCMVSHAMTIKKEYRLIFINNNYISGSQYMNCGELCVSSEVPEEVIEYGKQTHTKYHLPPWVVLDIGEVYNTPRVIELNQLETSSFYAADLDKIYKTWADYYK